MIQRNYQEHLVAQTQFAELSQWLQTHTLDFREKRPTYQNEQVFVKTWRRGHLSPSDPLDPPGGSGVIGSAGTRTDDVSHTLIGIRLNGKLIGFAYHIDHAIPADS